MRRVLGLCVALAVLMGAAEAQEFIRYYPPAGIAELTSSGTAITSTLPIRLPDGASDAPSLTFSADTNNGLYRGGNDVLGFGVGGFGIVGVRGTAGLGYGLTIPNGSSIAFNGASIADTGDVFLVRDAANTLALRNSTTAQTFNIYNTYTDGSNYERFRITWDTNIVKLGTQQAGSGSARTTWLDTAVETRDLKAIVADTYVIGGVLQEYRSAYLSRSLQGSTSKTLVDNTATAFVRLAVADDDYEGCAIGWTAVAEDANGDARQIRKGRTNVAVLNNSGTEACNFSASTDDQAILVTAGTFTCSFDCNSAVADTVDLRATCDTSLDAAAEILTFEYRLDCESTVTVTPQ